VVVNPAQIVMQTRSLGLPAEQPPFSPTPDRMPLLPRHRWNFVADFSLFHPATV
jgi:hypothetical protein